MNDAILTGIPTDKVCALKFKCPACGEVHTANVFSKPCIANMSLAVGQINKVVFKCPKTNKEVFSFWVEELPFPEEKKEESEKTDGSDEAGG